MDAVPAPRITSSKENKSEPAVKGRWLVAPPPPSIRSMQTQWHGSLQSSAWLDGRSPFRPRSSSHTHAHSLNSGDGEPSQVSHSARGPLHGKVSLLLVSRAALGAAILRWIERKWPGRGG